MRLRVGVSVDNGQSAVYSSRDAQNVRVPGRFERRCAAVVHDGKRYLMWYNGNPYGGTGRGLTVSQ